MIYQQSKLKKSIRLLVVLIIISDFSYTYNMATENIITKICLEKFATEMKNAGMLPPPGMETFTCDCFLSKINTGLSITSAQSLCKDKAFEVFAE